MSIYQDATLVSPDAVALIVRANGDVELVIPDNEQLEWHSRQMSLAQLAIRFIDDPAWAQELADELKASAT